MSHPPPRAPAPGTPESVDEMDTAVVRLRPDVLPATPAEARERARLAARAGDAERDPEIELSAARVHFGGRLNVELRVAGMLGLLWWSTTTHALVWSFVTLPEAQLATLPWLYLALPHAVGLIALMFALALQMPRSRWPRTGSLVAQPGPLGLSLVGFPMLPVVPYLVARDRRARAERPDGDDVEVAFRQLMETPKILGGALLALLGGALLVDTMIFAAHLEWDVGHGLAFGLLFLALTTPMVAVAVSRLRAMLRAELIGAPRARPSALGPRRDVRASLALPSVLATFGVALGPVLGVWLWQAATDTERAQHEAELDALRLVDLARKDPQRLGRQLAEHPEAGVEVGTRWYGHAFPGLPGDQPLLDLDHDGVPELVRARFGEVTAIVPLPPPHRLPLELVLLSALLGLAAGVGTVLLVTTDVTRDIERATDQVRSVADGVPAEPVNEGSFFAVELRSLVQSVDRLVNRITETNVAKYVAIEKAKEADRLKSQFLANMSHDLRSPLNSILGFSELLITGIEGDLSPDQRRMVQTIYDSGRELLQQIDDILDTAKIDAGRMEVHPEPTPPANLITRAIQLARKRLPPGVSVATETAPGLPPAFVDPYRTVQALENVLVFAAERIEEGTLTVSLSTRELRRGPTVVVTVHTPTRPASGEELTAVLRGFFRIPGHRGLGLGLPIAGSILELQGGSMDILDAGVGAAFEVHLPAPEARRPFRFRETRR